MNISLIREIAVVVIAGSWFWILFRSLYGFALQKGQAEGYHFITVSPWLSLLCGHPLLHNRVETSLVTGQIGSLLLGIAWAPMFWLKLDHSQRVTVYIGLLLSTLALPTAMQIIRKLVNRRGESGKN